MFLIGNLVFIIGLFGVISNKKNILVYVIAIEIMLLGINMLFLYTSIEIDDLYGQLIFLFILAVAGAESAIGLALIVHYFRLRGSISINFMNFLKSLI